MLALSSQNCLAQTLPFHDSFESTTFAARNAHGFYLGHSLLSDIPDMVQSHIATVSDDMTFCNQDIPGAPLSWQISAAESGQVGGDPDFAVTYLTGLSEPDGLNPCQTRSTDIFVAVESVPRDPDAIDDTVTTFSKLANYATSSTTTPANTTPNPDMRIFFYEPWHCIDSGPQNWPDPPTQPTGAHCSDDFYSPTRLLVWEERLIADQTMWNQALAQIETQVTENTNPIRLIPAGRAFIPLIQAINNGELPGFTHYRDLFSDSIHTNHYGKLFVSFVTYAVIYGESPIGLDFLDISNRYGEPYWNTQFWDGNTYSDPDPVAVRRMQEIAWEVVMNEPLTGVAAN